MYLETMDDGVYKVFVKQKNKGIILFRIIKSRHVTCYECRLPGAPELEGIMSEENLLVSDFRVDRVPDSDELSYETDDISIAISSRNIVTVDAGSELHGRTVNVELNFENAETSGSPDYDADSDEIDTERKDVHDSIQKRMSYRCILAAVDVLRASGILHPQRRRIRVQLLHPAVMQH